VYYWTHGLSNKTIMALTGRSSNTIYDWMNLCRDVPVKMFEKCTKFGGPGIIIQVDKCLLRGLIKIIKVIHN